MVKGKESIAQYNIVANKVIDIFSRKTTGIINQGIMVFTGKDFVFMILTAPVNIL